MGQDPRIILVTGGAGFIGSALVRHLIRDTSHTVVNVDSLTYAGNLDSLAEVRGSPRHRFEHVDIRDDAEVRRVFVVHNPDAVVHLAAESHVDRSIDKPRTFLETNVLGTFTLLETALDHYRALGPDRRKAFRFLHVSTDEVFGEATPGTRFTEHSRYAPNSPYAASKAAADHLVRAWGKTYELPVLTTNCSNNYGPYQFPEKLIPHMILSALEDKELGVYGDGQQVRDWLHVEDHVRALMTVLDKAEPGSYFNIGGYGECRNIEIVRTVCEILDRLRPREDGLRHGDRVVFTMDRPGHDSRYAIDASQLCGSLGWKPQIDLEDGLENTVKWYLDRQDWWEPLRQNRYRGERLGRGVGRSATTAIGDQ